MMPDTCNEVQLGKNACAAFLRYVAELLLNLLGKLLFRRGHADLHGLPEDEGGREKLQQNQCARLMVPPRTAIHTPAAMCIACVSACRHLPSIRIREPRGHAPGTPRV